MKNTDATLHYLLNCARHLIQDNLGVRHEELLIITDKSGLPVAEYVAEAADQLNVGHLIAFVPIATQRRFPDDGHLSLTLEGAIRSADTILSCVTDEASCTPFRRAIISRLTPRKRLGHMPGASLDMLTLAGGDLPALIRRCRELALALAQGKRLELLSFDANGKAHRLTLALGGWDRMPIVSSGKIERGAWGNVPSGETCIAPLEGTAEGQVVISGAVPGHVITPGEEIVITFRAGRAVSFRADDETALDLLQRRQLDWARAQGDENWNHLGEVGIGVNDGVGRLTGVELIDEKKAGTAHIALGDSTVFGGLLGSLIHVDLIIDAPTLLVDGRPILEKGEWRLKADEWCIKHQQVQVPPGWEQSIGRIYLTGAAQVHEGVLQRAWREESGRIDFFLVGCPETARLAARVYNLLKDATTPVAMSQLSAAWGSQSPRVLYQVLKIMAQHKVVHWE